MGRVISEDGIDTWRRAHVVHGRQIFASFYISVLRNKLGGIMASRLSIVSFVYSILVKVINSKDKVERWHSEVKVEGQIRNWSGQ